MSDVAGTEKYYYDQLGRTKKITKHVDTNDYTVQYAYDGVGRIKYLTYPDNDVVKYSYNIDGSLYQILNNADNTAYATYTGYNALGQPGTITFKNGVITSYTYYPANNLLHTIFTSSTATTMLDLSYGYDNGYYNITDITDNTPRTQAPHIDEVASYDYGISGTKPHAVAHNLSSGVTFSYDANGNMTADGERNIIYNHDNMPALISMNGNTTSFVYDGGGDRVEKIAPDSGTTIYIGRLYVCRAGTCTKQIYAGRTLLASKTGTNIYYYHPDHLGSTSAMSDASGAVAGSIQYFPFGETRASSVPTSFLYTSQEFDDETVLYNYNARFYNPSLGRFISADTIVPLPANPQSLNRYSYVMNNPVKYTDPSGHNLLDDLSNVEKHARREVNRASRNTTNGYLVNFFVDPTLGHYMIGQTTGGRNYIAGEMIVATIVATVATAYCGGCGGGLMAGVSGALIGELEGAYSASKCGGDLLNGVAVGGAVGYVSGYAGYYAGNWAGGLFDKGSLYSYLATGVTRGAIEGAGTGAVVGYAGGAGSWQNGALIGAEYGAIGGALIGAGQWGVKEAELMDKVKAIDELNADQAKKMAIEGAQKGLKAANGSADIGAVLSSTVEPFIKPITKYVLEHDLAAYGVLSAAVAAEISDGAISGIIERGFGGSYKFNWDY